MSKVIEIKLEEEEVFALSNLIPREIRKLEKWRESKLEKGQDFEFIEARIACYDSVLKKLS